MIKNKEYILGFLGLATLLLSNVQDFYGFMDRDLGEKGGSRGPIEDDTLEIYFKDVSFKYPKTDQYISIYHRKKCCLFL